MQNIPKIRFRGFAGEWGESILEDLCRDTYSGGTPSVGVRAYYGGKTPFIRSGEIHSDSTELFISELGLQNSSAKMVAKGDILYALYGATSGEVGISKIDGAINQAILAIQLKPENSSNFVATWLQYNRESIISTYLQGGQGNLSGEIVKKLIVNTANPEEQKQIGKYFLKLDQLIGLHEQKLEKLITLKKAMLKKMFPTHHSVTPEIRFKGFSKPWKVEKLGEMSSFISNNTLSRVELNYNSGMAKNVHYGDVLIKFGEVLDVNKDDLPYICNNELINKLKPLKLEDGDIVIADAAEDESVGKCTELINVGDTTVFAGLHTIAVRPTVSFAAAYLGYFMNSFAYHDQLLGLMQGTKVLSISRSAIKDTSVFSPTEEAEQAKIGKYFYQLDELIGQHGTQIQKLKQIKSACLKKMFV